MSMPFYNPPPSLIKGSSPDCDNDGLSGRSACSSSNKLEPDSLNSTTCSGHVSQAEFTKCTPSFSDTCSESPSDDGILDPIIPPPNLNDLRLHMKHGKPYKRDGLNISECHSDNQLLQSGSIKQVDVQKGKQILGGRLQDLSSEAMRQAIAAKDADVEWRRLCAMTTAWEVYARGEHLKYLNMLLEDQWETYASAVSEPLDTTIEYLLGISEGELKDNMSCGVAASSHDVTEFFVGLGDAQFDHLEGAATPVGLDNSGV